MEHVIVHPVRPLGQDLVDMMATGRTAHDGEYLVNLMVGHFLMEEVTMGTHEDPAGFLPSGGLVVPLVIEPNLTRPLAIVMVCKAFPAWVILEAGGCEAHGIAVGTPWGNHAATRDRVPGTFAPLYFCFISHDSSLYLHDIVCRLPAHQANVVLHNLSLIHI